MARSPYAGRRPPTASVPLVNEERFVARYQKTGNLSQCLREFDLTKRRGLAILARHGESAGAKRRTEVDEDAILRAFGKLKSVTAVAGLQGIGEADVRATLDRHGMAHDTRVPAPDYDSKTLAQKKAQRRRAGKPLPSDLLYPSEAAQIAGVASGSLLAGRLPNRGSQYFPRYRRDEVLGLTVRTRSGNLAKATIPLPVNLANPRLCTCSRVMERACMVSRLATASASSRSTTRRHPVPGTLDRYRQGPHEWRNAWPSRPGIARSQ